MKNRLSTLGKSASWMLVLLAACGITSSCKDEYTLDDEKPSWLNTSIFQSLESQGNYTYYLRLLDDDDVNPSKDDVTKRRLSEILSRTGSRTVFVADDDAWEEFFKKNAALPESNPWHNATSYDKLSLAQKKMLIHTSMLDNAIVTENLASNLENGTMTRGLILRRETEALPTDSITHLSPSELPVNYNVGNGETDYWARFRAENGGTGIYLAPDSVAMMQNFTNEYLKKNNITDADFAIITGEERKTEDVHIFDAKLLSKDEVCENGYVNKTEKVLTPPTNMAEVLRTNGETNIFSHMLDRWSVPFKSPDILSSWVLTKQARGETWDTEKDSIYIKRYFSDLSWNHAALTDDELGNQFRDAQSTDVGLKFDPGWSMFYDEQADERFDMAAMYVPNDETLWKYFMEGGGGWQLIQTYYLHTGEEDDNGNSIEIPYVKPTNLDELYHQIDQIPISTLRSLLNIIMFKSFVSSVPSKMTSLRDDAQEQIFYADDVDHIKKGLLANNGVIYITDKVYGPADYTSVAAPAYISGTNLIMRWAIYNGSTATTDYMGLNYYAYLKAMQSKFAFFLPSDKGLAYYYDPVSFKSKKSRVVKFKHDKKKTFPIDYATYEYDPATGAIKGAWSLEKMANTDIVTRLKDVLESHTIVLDSLAEIDSDIDQFYLTKNGSVVKVTRGTDAQGKTRIIKAQGGFQLENESEGITGYIDEATNKGEYTEIRGIQENIVTDEQEMSNGRTYILDSPIIPAAKSIYNNFTNNDQKDSPYYNNFYTYCCQPIENIIKACGLVDTKTLTTSQQKSEIKKFQVFVNNNDAPDYNIQFFNNYNYTIFVPTNEAMDAAVSNGLPTWEEIEEDFNNCEKDEHENLVNLEDSIRLQAKITYITNFVRYHFADNSVFVDKSKINPSDYITSSYDNVKGLFCKVNVKRDNGVLEVKDVNGGDWLQIQGRYNVLARDIVSNKKIDKTTTTMNGITIDGSSFAVLHQIPSVLNHTKLVNGRYDSTWATTSEAKQYLLRFAIH